MITEKLSLAYTEETTTSVATLRGVDTVLPRRESLADEMQDRRIRLYLGIDPTSPDLHYGHTVPLRKLRHFQDLGHEVNLLFGTFTGMIGDPTDKSAARVKLSEDQINHNVKTYAEQASKVLDLSPEATNPINIVYNHEWLGKLSFEQVVELASNFTVQQMLKRNMFQDRMEQQKPVYLHEFLYPLMQGYDSLAMDVDLEIGGKDQLFNMMVGKFLVNRYKGHEKWVMGTKLIEDPSGKKMGKTEGNIVNVKDFPEVAFEALMTWPDETIPLGLELLTTVPIDTVRQISNELPNIISGESQVGIVELKEAFAERVVSELHGEQAGDYAEEEFDRVKRRGEELRRIRQVPADLNSNLSTYLVVSGLARDTEEARDKITRGAIYVGNQRIRKDIRVEDKMIIKIGKKAIGNARQVIID